MNTDKKKLFILFITGAAAGILLMFLYQYFSADRPVKTQTENTISAASAIADLTGEKRVISFVKANKTLPEYYLTKNEARKKGWNAENANMCEVLPGKALGGDHFGNREKLLPQEKKYFEADVNVNCGKRNADRIIYTAEGEVWLTKDHYRSFVKQ